jgi:3-vinyl bacteriochlorophyllide hydratase
MFTGPRLARWIDAFDVCPWPSLAGQSARHPHRAGSAHRAPPAPLYTPEERVRRDASPWTMVQGVLAPLQFLVFLVSLGLVLRTLWTGEGYGIATASVVAKTFVLYTIMVTGSIWEKEVFGRYLFAPAFFWEDVFSMLVLGLHTAYLVAVVAGWGLPEGQLFLALAAYVAYVVNAVQFVLKLRAARRQEAAVAAMGWSGSGGHPGDLGYSK